jgi:AAA domain-containing protein/LonB protease-like protein
MWGKRRSEAASALAPAVPSTVPSRALTSVDDLRRSASWESLSDGERDTLRSAFAPFPASASVADLDASVRADAAVQDWVAGLVAPTFQTESAQVIQAWLSETTPHAHLFVGGASGQGRTSLVASLARQAMAQRPAPHDHIYVPEPSALDQAYLLALPRGTGKDFATAIDQTLRQITSGWDGDDDDDSGGSSGNDGAAQGAAPSASPSKAQLVAQAFAGLETPAFEPASGYVGKLRAAFEALAAAKADLPVSYDDLATWLVRASADPSAASASSQQDAPVIIGTLIRDKLEDLLMRANGGVLILPAADLLAVDGAWLNLSAALGSRRLIVKSSWPGLPLTARVALVGGGSVYNALASASSEFTRLFRYEAWLNSTIPWNPSGEAAYAAMADGAARYHGLPAFDPSGVARLVEEGARRGDGLNRGYLTSDLILLRDLAVEAGSVARARDASATSGVDVATALQRRRASQGANARRVREAILSGQANTPTAGAAVGQINGLGVYEFHPSEGNFAVPTRISATVSPGRDERLLDIEREAEQADADHVRGALTIEGYLAYRYGQTRPLNLTARIRFEQEHGTTGGDSASGAILFAVLSALAQVPIRYSYAVTGAVGQYGEMQPIGSVNTKIEGFWELCRQRRAQGEQADGGYGVLIPAVNARDLMLRDEVAESIATEGWFRVWLVNTVDDALAILTGVPTADIHTRVEQRLQRFHELGTQRGG